MATEACMQIIEELRTSSLNFVIRKKPYSAYISLRKRFLNNVVPKSKSFFLRHSDLQIENETLKKQVTEVSAKLEESEAKCDLANEIIEILEAKVMDA